MNDWHKTTLTKFIAKCVFKTAVILKLWIFKILICSIRDKLYWHFILMYLFFPHFQNDKYLFSFFSSLSHCSSSLHWVFSYILWHFLPIGVYSDNTSSLLNICHQYLCILCVRSFSSGKKRTKNARKCPLETTVPHLA